jgi:hypothetical protein
MGWLMMSYARAIAAALMVAVAAAPVLAQSDFPSSGSTSAAAGWILTPSIVYSGAWDDNVLIKGEGDEITGDLMNVVNPRIDISRNGRHAQFGANYDGAFLLYRDLGSLNSYDQHMSVSGRRQVSRHMTIFARNGFAAIPTTQSTELVGVPFVRTGSTIDDLQAGIETVLTKRTTLSTAYNFQWVHFEDDPTLTTILRGGFGNGGSVALRHVLSARLTAFANYGLQYSVVSDTREAFTVHNADAGFEYRLTEYVRVFAGGGVSRLSINAYGPARTGPSIRAGISRQFETANAGLTYSRSFIPSYGFGGTTQNEELTGHLHLPLARRLYSRASVAFRRNEPLTVGQALLGQELLRSFWVEASVGYVLRPSVRLEGFYGGAHQVIARSGGVTNRNRMGVQLVTFKPMRVR